jgi:outer membrane protein OmpA-like peptidoglycan-associated protein
MTRNTVLNPLLHWAATFAVIVAAGCAAPVVEEPKAEPAGTTVILLPDDDGKVGTVIVKAAGQSRVIDQAYQSVSAPQDQAGLSDTRQLDLAQIDSTFGTLLKAQPTQPSRFLLYFASGSELTSESLAQVSQIIDTIKTRAPTEVIVIGHTDTTGSDALNARLARERATTVEKMLKGKMPSLDRVTVQSHGSRDLLIATPPNVVEPRNRRVEVVVL